MHPRDTYAAYEAEAAAEELRQREALLRYLERRNPVEEIPRLNVLTTAVAMILVAAILTFLGFFAHGYWSSLR